MQLDILERMLLLKALSTAEGDLTILRVVRDLQSELSFSEAEHKEFEFRHEGTAIFWNQKKASLKEVMIGPAGLEASLSMFKRLDEMKKLTLEYLPLYERLLKEKARIESPPKLHEAGAPGA